MTDRPDVAPVDDSNPLIRKLDHARILTDGDRAALREVCRHSRAVEAGWDVIKEGEGSQNVYLVLDGMACHYKLLSEGARAITGLLLPGDLCGLHGAILGKASHSAATLSACTLVEISETVINDLTQKHPNIARAFWWEMLVNEATLREWLTGLGRRDGMTRMAHLFCELLLRLQVVGRAEDNSFAFPLTQGDLADVLGLTSVHVNRVVQDLRKAELIVLDRRWITMLDVDRLRQLCSFDPSYLHLSGRMM